MRLMLMMVPTIMRRTEAKSADLTIQFLTPVVKITVATRIGKTKAMAGRILPVGLKKRSVRIVEEKTFPTIPK